MTEHTTTQNTSIDNLIQLLLKEGYENGLPRIAEMILNAAMFFERSAHLAAHPYERSEHRNGYGNGFKDRTFKSISLHRFHCTGYRARYTHILASFIRSLIGIAIQINKAANPFSGKIAGPSSAIKNAFSSRLGVGIVKTDLTNIRFY